MIFKRACICLSISRKVTTEVVMLANIRYLEAAGDVLQRLGLEFCVRGREVSMFER